MGIDQRGHAGMQHLRSEGLQQVPAHSQHSSRYGVVQAQQQHFVNLPQS